MNPFEKKMEKKRAMAEEILDEKDLSYAKEFALLALFNFLNNSNMKRIGYSHFNFLLLYLMVRVLVIQRRLDRGNATKLNCPKLAFIRHTVSAALIKNASVVGGGPRRKKIPIISEDWFEVQEGEIGLTSAGRKEAEFLANCGKECEETMHKILNMETLIFLKDETLDASKLTVEQILFRLKKVLARFKPGKTISWRELEKVRLA